jgi:hypothetical protein
MPGSARLCLAVRRRGTCCKTSNRPTTAAVIVLRKATAVATSTPWLKATRAATWLAPIMKAISSRVAKAVRVRGDAADMG